MPFYPINSLLTKILLATIHSILAMVHPSTEGSKKKLGEICHSNVNQIIVQNNLAFSFKFVGLSMMKGSNTKLL